MSKRYVVDSWGGSPPLPVCRHRRSGPGRPIAVAVAVLVGVGWVSGEAEKTAKTATPKPQVIVHQTTKYLPAPHPWISGSEVVWICVIAAVVVIALGIALIRRAV